MIDPDDEEMAAIAATAATDESVNGRETREVSKSGDDTEEPASKRRKTFHKSEAQLKGEQERRQFAQEQEKMFRGERAQSKIDHIRHLQEIARERSSAAGEDDNETQVEEADDTKDDISRREKDTWTGRDEDKRIRGGVEEATLDEEGHIARLGYEEEEEEDGGDDNGGDFEGDGYRYDGDIRIEPFNLKKERETGYFDESGFYVANEQKEERDAWLDEEYDKTYAKELRRPENKAKILRNLARERQTYEFNFGSSDSEGDDDDDNDENNSRNEKQANKKCTLLRTIIGLLSKDTETVSDGLRRLGNKKSKDADPEKFNALTDAADGLLGSGNMGIYSETKTSLTKALRALTKEPFNPGSTTTVNAAEAHGVHLPPHQEPKLWEYKFESGDGSIQGPFTSQQMAYWQAQGYFSGPYVALVRPAKKKTGSLLDDLEDDDDNNNNNNGEFTKSDTIDFSKEQ